ncbi:helicase-related protein [Pedomonas mirosovicensis]|uniref:helicase-related protein n=1 Tax=Pedomonas mirosovicensis TaxID=2908641 RepID=UPI0035BC1ABF
MGALGLSKVTAVLGPTNTGKTHLAVERLCAHSSGMIGFPLRLLAREVYDRVVAIKGPEQVALITGEERIVPPNARYFLCTAESMPLDREVSFLALDEAQLGADDERGHIFTDRLLRARGRDETMILGSDALRPLVSKLLPDAEIISRPRFSTLSYAAPKKLSRVPKRTAIVAFSADQVYAIGEMLRRQRGGVAVVMGSLSPRTRNAQVGMYQSGEVDYLVATDAIGMGLNMDISHVAFAGLSKFDGKRHRRLTPAEMAQIAGRAGRHQRDGTFGTVQFGEERRQLTPEEILAIENHTFAPLEHLMWRSASLDFQSVGALIRSLDARPPRPELLKADDAIDLAVLRRLAQEPLVEERARRSPRVRRLWDACQVPDYRKVSPDIHARLVLRIFKHLSEGNGTLPTDWIAGEIARLDQVNGDIETIAGRIAGIRTWSYISQRADWLEDPAHWAGRARALEDRLSDVLHERLIQRFVDRRTSVLLRSAGGRGAIDVEVDEAGTVEVEGHSIGTLSGFTFTMDADARHEDRRRMMAAAERALSAEMTRRAKALAESGEGDIGFELGQQAPHVRLLWKGARVAYLAPGRDPLSPRVRLEAGASLLAATEKASVLARLEAWVMARTQDLLKPLMRLAALAEGEGPQGIGGAARGLAVHLVQGLGVARRESAEAQISALSRDERRWLAKAGIKIGARHVYAPAVLKPAAMQWRVALWAAASHFEGPLPSLPENGPVSVPVDPSAPKAVYAVAGYWVVGDKAVRVDLVERLLDVLREQAKGGAPVIPTGQLVSMVGLSQADFSRLMVALGYRRTLVQPEGEGAEGETTVAYKWKGYAANRRRAARGEERKPAPAASPFAALAAWRSG